jgi:hypothetical protein
MCEKYLFTKDQCSPLRNRGVTHAHNITCLPGRPRHKPLLNSREQYLVDHKQWTTSLYTPNIIANVRHAWPDECAVRATREKLKLSYGGGDSGSKKWWRLWWCQAESAFSGSLESGGRFCVGAFGRNPASIAVKMFSHLIYFINKFL